MPVAAIIVGGALGAAAFTAGIVGTASLFTCIMIGASIGSLFMSNSLDDYNSSPTYSMGSISNTMSQNVPIPVIYGGDMRVAGNIIYQAFDSDEKKVQTLYVLLSEGEIQSVTDVKANDDLVTSLPDCSYTAYLNTTSGTHDSRDPSGTRPYPNDVALLCITLTASDKLSGSPTITSIVKGKKVWTPSGKVWSNNPIWCAIDLLAHPRYGLGLCTYSGGAYDHPDWDKIDYSCAVAAANYCDTLISGKKRFTLTYVLDTQKAIKETLSEMLQVCRGYIVENEKIEFHIEAAVSTVSHSITEANIEQGSFTWWQKTDSDMANQVSLCWTDPSNAYDQVLDYAQDDTDIADRGLVTQSYTMVGITDKDEAERMLWYLLKTNLLVKNLCSFRVGIKDIDIRAGEVISISFPSFTGWSNKWFRVISTKIESETAMTVTAGEYIADCYNDSSCVIVAHIDTQRKTSYTPAEVTNLTVTEEVTVAADGQYVDTAIATWTVSSYANSVEVWYRFDNDAAYTMAATLYKGSTEYRLDCTTHSVVYIKIVTVSSIGIHSSGVMVRHAITGDTTAPAAPTNLSATGGYKLANLKWTDPADNDLNHIDVYRSSDSTNYAVAGQVTRGTQAFIDANLGILTTYWYKLKAVDNAGNESAFSSVITAMTEAIPQSDIPDFSIDETKTVTDIFGDNESTAKAIVEQVLNNYGDNKQQTAKILQTNNALDAAKEILAEAQVDISALQTTSTETVSRLGTAEQRITTAEGVLDEAVADIEAIDTRVGTTESQIATANVTIAGHTASISSLTQRVGTAESDIDSAEQDIETLQETTASQATSLQSVTQRVGATETNVTNLTTTVNGAVADISTLETDLGSTKVKVERNIGAVDENTAENNNVALAQVEDTLSLYRDDKQQKVKISEVKEVLDDVTGRWYVKIDNNKRVAGLALYNGSEDSNFTVLADKFYIYGTGTGGTETKQIFAVDTTTGKVTLQGDLLADGSITGAKINAAAQITLGSGGQLVMGSGSVLQMASGTVVLDSTTGVLQIKDPDNLTTGDYIRIEEGDITTYKYIGGEYVAQKSLRQMAYGEATSGTAVTLPGKWSSVPSIIVSPLSINTFDPNYSTLAQRLTCSAGIPTLDTSTGTVTFTPTVKLRVTSTDRRITPNVKNTQNIAWADWPSTSARTLQSANFTIPAYTSRIRGDLYVDAAWRQSYWAGGYIGGGWTSPSSITLVVNGTQYSVRSGISGSRTVDMSERYTTFLFDVTLSAATTADTTAYFVVSVTPNLEGQNSDGSRFYHRTINGSTSYNFISVFVYDMLCFGTVAADLDAGQLTYLAIAE